MKNKLMWIVLTITKNSASLSFVRTNTTQVYFLNDQHTVGRCSMALGTALDMGWSLQENVSAGGTARLFYSDAPIPRSI